MSVYELDMLNEMGEDVGVLEGAGGVEKWTARFAPVNAGSDPPVMTSRCPAPCVFLLGPGRGRDFA